MSLTDFLLARITQDEGAARAALQPGGGNVYTDRNTFGNALLAHIARHDPARVLADCEAKRRIVALAVDGFEHNPNSTLRILAAVYADHPAYQEEWRQ